MADQIFSECLIVWGSLRLVPTFCHHCVLGICTQVLSFFSTFHLLYNTQMLSFFFSIPCFTLFSTYPSPIYSIYCLFNYHIPIYRRDRLWMATEYCGGGSVQSIYHGSPNSYSLNCYNTSYIVYIVTNQGLNELQIAFISREMLKVSMGLLIGVSQSEPLKYIVSMQCRNCLFCLYDVHVYIYTCVSWVVKRMIYLW